MEYHEAADIYPLLEGEEFDALVEDIRANGLRVPILRHKGKILDGRNRWRACDVAGAKPRFEEWDGAGSPVDAVVSYNDTRRHLDSGQRAVSALKAEKLLAAEAKARQLATLKQNAPVGQKIEQREKGQKGGQKVAHLNDQSGRAAAQAAKKVGGTNRQYVFDAKKIDAQAPELLKDVHEGKLPIQDAKKVATLPEEARSQAVREIVDAPTPQAKREIAREAVREAQRKPEETLTNTWQEVEKKANDLQSAIKRMNARGGTYALMEEWPEEYRERLAKTVKGMMAMLNDFYNDLKGEYLHNEEFDSSDVLRFD